VRSDSSEPFAGKSGAGAVWLEENVVVRRDEPEILSKYPFEEILSDKTQGWKGCVNTGRWRGVSPPFS
jgi:hypothetical protein